MNKINIFCTLGPSSLNRNFLKFAEKNKVDLLRINLSHIQNKNLQKIIFFIKKNCKIKICLDTEGAQIRSKIYKKKFFKLGNFGIISKKKSKNFLSLYPDDVFDKLRIKDELDVGFDGLIVKLIRKKKDKFFFKTISPGYLEKNKGVHLINRKIKLNFLTKKDIQAIEVAKKNKINNFALSFTNSVEDIKKFKALLPKKSNKIYKIETRLALKNFKDLLINADNFLIDRGDLSKEISIEEVPIAQRKIIKNSKKYKFKKIFIATNFLESMIKNSTPTRAESNDIYNSLEMGASGLVLAAETAIGRYPEKCILFLKSMIKKYKKKINSF